MAPPEPAGELKHSSQSLAAVGEGVEGKGREEEREDKREGKGMEEREVESWREGEGHNTPPK